MVHVGDENFFRETYAEAFSHDVVLVEGVDSSVSRNLTRSYRWIDYARLGLVRQPKTPPQEEVTARIVNADLSAGEFDQEWRKTPAIPRAIFNMAAPLFGIYRRVRSSREGIARNLCLDDLRSEGEVLNWSSTFEPFRQILLDARDARLIACIEAELANDSEKRVAVVFGARHMRAVLRYLASRGFRCTDASWRTIIAVES